jgi:sulfatase maturation enzyme AslB (radical SAM superfamily)
MFDRDHINVFLRVQQGCNLNCDHCFTLGNKDKVLTTPFEYVEGFLNALDKNVDPQSVTLYLHGGETFLAKISHLRQVTDYAKSVFADKKLTIIPQTNLVYKITEDWLTFVKEDCGGQIGVSWDAKIRFGSIKSEHEVRNEKLFFENLKILRDNGIKYYITICAQKHLLNIKPWDIANMFEGAASIDFEHLTVFDEKTKDLRLNLKKWSNWYDALLNTTSTTRHHGACLRWICLPSRSRTVLFITASAIVVTERLSL